MSGSRFVKVELTTAYDDFVYAQAVVLEREPYDGDMEEVFKTPPSGSTNVPTVAIAQALNLLADAVSMGDVELT